ncbi:MAG: EamA family transporter [Ponticaulis sp.]|nr:EamA family transporter [Ponticaulis sp.]|tara:strand:+ start:27799 stop:28722 length:924 start_codon:yes stop_codon:yes gene_type:complete
MSQDQAQRELLIGTALLFVGSLMLGFAAIGLRLAVQDGVGAQTTALWRFLLALPMFGVIYAFQRRFPKKPTLFVLLTGLFFGLDIGTWHLALTMTSVANATFIVNIGSICVGFLAWIFLRERPSVFWGIAVALALGGAWMLSQGGQSASGSGGYRGDLVACIAACFISFYFLCGRIARRNTPALDVIFWATIVMAIVAAGYCILFSEPLLPQKPSDLTWPFFIALFSHIGGQALIIAGLGKAPAAIAGIMVILQPVGSALASWPMFGEELALLQLAGAALILVALLISQMNGILLRPNRKNPTKLSH